MSVHMIAPLTNHHVPGCPGLLSSLAILVVLGHPSEFTFVQALGASSRVEFVHLRIR